VRGLDVREVHRVMSELLLEIMCEEIPARMQVKAGVDLARMLSDALGKAGLTVDNVQTFTGPRRLVFVADVPPRSPDVKEERKGPRVGSPEQALAGFMRGAGLSDISEAEIRSDKKGEHYVAVLEKPGRDAGEIISEAVPEIMGKFPWPKSMKSGGSPFRWVRPLTSILCILDSKIVPFNVAGIDSGNITQGHRRMGRGPFSVTNFKAYKNTLQTKGHVILSAQARSDMILRNAKTVCAQAGLELVEDIGLLAEVAGLVEWPVVILGDMDAAFLELPADVIRLSMRTHQKYFAVKDKQGKLAPNFVVVANQEAPDGGVEIAKGNARVLSARLDDAKFFQAEDAKRTLESRYDELDGIVFHQKLGTVKDKAERVARYSSDLASKAGASEAATKQAARLAKCDLVTNMVVEFTSLQGKIGRLIFEGEGGDKDIAIAIEDHYKPQGPSDRVPINPVAVAVALADKLDSLACFWAIDERPTGSKDPFALRRSALGVTRIILANNLRGLQLFERLMSYIRNVKPSIGTGKTQAENLLTFILGRLKVHLREQGVAHDHIDAVFALGGDDLVDISNRIKALGAFLSTDDGANLLAGYKRAVNILKAEAKKGTLPDAPIHKGTQPQEADLFGAIGVAEPLIEKALAAEDYAGAMAALAGLRGAIDGFFDDVIVNSDVASERENRLGLLMKIRELAGRIANFDKVEG